jgi:hypothetical protein
MPLRVEARVCDHVEARVEHSPAVAPLPSLSVKERIEDALVAAIVRVDGVAPHRLHHVALERGATKRAEHEQPRVEHEWALRVRLQQLTGPQEGVSLAIRACIVAVVAREAPRGENRLGHTYDGRPPAALMAAANSMFSGNSQSSSILCRT